MERLEGKIAVVVGGGQTPGTTMGNGRATALRFAQEGASVLVADRDEASAAETVAMIENDGGNASAVGADVTVETDCEQIIATCVERYQRIDILHNNVGIGTGDRGPASMTEEIWDRIFATNLKGVMFSCNMRCPSCGTRAAVRS